MHATQTGSRFSQYICVFIIALVVLAYQVLLTRIFSVMLYYHFAFLGVSLAMLGLTVGAEYVYFKKERFSRENLELEFAKAALGFSISSVAIVLVFIYAPLIQGDQHFVTLSMLLFVIPFIYSSICVTLILTKSSFSIGKLYAADLVGAAIGCIGIVLVLFCLDPISIVFALATLSACAAWLIVHGRNKKIVLYAQACVAVMLVSCVTQSTLYLSGSEHLRVVWTKNGLEKNLLFERWNTFSRVRIIPYGDKPMGWGFGHEIKERVEQRYLDIDADASTIITKFDGDVTKLSYLGDDVINIGYHIRPVQEVAVIGVGGGRDI
jgi:hypothetical protein